MRVTLALALLAVAGCTRPPDIPVVPTPAWQPGEAWTYTLRDEHGADEGWVRYTVQGIEPVAEVTPRAYRVLREWYDAGQALTPRAMHRSIVHFDAATLRTVWNHCADPGREPGACSGSSNHDVEFPLWPGKTWSEACCGHEVVDYDHRVEEDDRGRLVVTRTVRHNGQVQQVDTFAPELGFYALRRGQQTWELRAHELLAVTDPTGTTVK